MKMFYHKTPSPNLARLRSLAECFGISSELVDAGDACSLGDALKGSVSSDAGAVLDLASLKDLGYSLDLQKVTQQISDSNIALLLLATGAEKGLNQMLQDLTQGSVSGVAPAAKLKTVSFTRKAHEWNQELSGQVYPGKCGEGLILTTCPKAGADSIVELDGLPSFIHVRLGKARLFIWSTLEIIDVFRPLSAELEFESATHEYIPAIIFLRSAFGDRCWQNPNLGAGIVIDDPLLKRRYGFIDFPDLLSSARNHGYHVTVAFIPWNFWRGRARQIQLFRQYSDCFSICLHGCDHTDDEYGSDDYQWLLAKSAVAVDRMNQHRGRTGIGCEPIMVFPQESYSCEAIQALSANGQFLALLNTRCIPPKSINRQICAADILVPAQDSLFGFPVFKRHYWSDMSAFAMGLFLGKPAILVEHHEFFKNGCSGMENFASQLAEIRPGVKWQPISQIVTSTHLRKRTSKNDVEIRFFSNKFQFRHEGSGPKTYRLRKRLPGTSKSPRLLLNGKQVPFSTDNGNLAFEIHTNSAQTFMVQIETGFVKPASAYSPGLRYHVGVALRRALSEFRDNLVSRNDFALRSAKSLVRTLKISADSKTTKERAKAQLL
jgi:hypothetical protein